MIYNLVSELNEKLKFSLSIPSRQSEWTGDELLTITSMNVSSLTEEDITLIATTCKKYGIKLMSWNFSMGVEEKTSGFFFGNLDLKPPYEKRKINILTLYVRPMFKWENV